MSSRKQGKGHSGGDNATTKRGSAREQAHAPATDQPEEEPLLAVILADSYNDHFAPLTLSWPRCLLPLANVPLLHYSIESATRAGVQQIYVLSRSHAQRIRQHVQDSLQAMLNAQGITITVLSTPEALSEGDALRELDAKQIIRTDFLLLRADSVCTFDLQSVVERHRQRRAADKDVIMTMCSMSTLQQTPMRPSAVEHIHYVDPSTNQILHYETLYSHPKKKAVMPFELLQLNDKDGSEEIDIRSDLVDAGVYVCSIDVPPLFSENFDYQSLQIDFIPGILTSDLLESKIFLHVGKRGYGGRAQDTQTYNAISRDVLRRWTNPITPASSAWIGERLTERRGWRYVGQDVQSDRTCNVGQCSMIASRCVLSSNATILGSVLCNDVRIGQSSTIIDSHLHTSASVGANVTMKKCIIGRGAKVLDNVELGTGCLIGADCIIGPDVRLPDGSRVGIREKETWNDEEEDDEDGKADALPTSNSHDTALGSESRGVLWPNLWLKNKGTHVRESDDESDDDDEEEEELANRCLRAIGYTDSVEAGAAQDGAEDDNESVSSIDYDSQFGSDDDDDGLSDAAHSAISSSAFSNVPGARTSGGITNLTLVDEGDTQIEKDAKDARLKEFEAEARASLTRAFEEDHSVDNANLELKTLRMASNVAPRDVQRIVLEVLLDQCKPSEPKQVQALITRWNKLIVQSTQEEEVQTLVMLQTYCATRPSHFALFVPLLKLFYNDDVVSDESIVAWWRSKDSQTGGEKSTDLRTRAQGVVRYILENDEDDDSDESDEE